ncbi:MAG: flagellar basal-body rod protein FlgF [Thalassobaculales bacterium]
MENPALIALSRQTALRRNLDIVANNVANVSTKGYRAEQLLFSEYLEKLKPNENRVAFTQDLAVAHNLQAGPMEATGNAFDMALDGQGFFVIQTPGGLRYTRDGAFSLDVENRLVTRSGMPVLDINNNEIRVPADDPGIDVDERGVIRSGTGDEIASLRIVQFENEFGLRKAGANTFSSENDPTPAANFRLARGMLEGSNVVPVVELTRMIEIQRAYESTQRMIDQEQERQREAVRRLGRAPGTA